MSEWISVEDRLPECMIIGESSKGVLAISREGRFFVAAVDYSDSATWFETVEYKSIHSVTHWMPLPEPPK